MVQTKNTNNLIIDALSDARYNARTIRGVAKFAKVSPSVVINELNTDPVLNQLVKIYPRRNRAGHVLITTRDKFDRSASIKDKFIDAFGTRRVVIKDEY